MVIKVYISGISASKEVKKRQQRAMFILDSLKVDYEALDITEPGNQEANERFREVCKRAENEKMPLPPQFFNDDNYCGDWDDFFAASDDDTVLQFLHLSTPGKGEETHVVPFALKQEEAIDDHAFEQEIESEAGRKSVNGHVDGDDTDPEDTAGDPIVSNGIRNESEPADDQSKASEEPDVNEMTGDEQIAAASPVLDSNEEEEDDEVVIDNVGESKPSSPEAEDREEDHNVEE